MDVIGMLNLDELAHGLAGMTMFPYFDTAHYVVSVMALREQSGEPTSGSFRSSRCGTWFGVLEEPYSVLFRSMLLRPILVCSSVVLLYYSL